MKRLILFHIHVYKFYFFLQQECVKKINSYGISVGALCAVVPKDIVC